MPRLAQDCELLGLHPDFGRPEEYIWQYISVPPVCIRPSVAQDGATCVLSPPSPPALSGSLTLLPPPSSDVSHSNEDDLTVKLGEIVFANSLIKAGLAKGVTTANLIVRAPPCLPALRPLD